LVAGFCARMAPETTHEPEIGAVVIRP
jgi:hypothetical protein